jgi:hypothetical protein
MYNTTTQKEMKMERSEFGRLVDFRSGEDFPEWAKDGISNRTTVHLGWADRLKVLLFGRLEVDTFTATEHEVGRTESRGCVHVYRPRWPRKPIAFEAVATPPAGEG